jgi:DNA modification methylase
MSTQPNLKIEFWPIENVINYARNSRLHSESQVASIAASIKEFGFINPCLVDPDGTLIAGHGRVMACKSIGIDKVPVIKLGHLNENQIKALRIADNQLPQLASWSPDLLRMELNDLQLAGYDMPLLGFDNIQLVQFMANMPSGADPEATPEPSEKPISRLGDVWLLGKHRILCGDSTKADDVGRVLDGKKPHLMVTDPPYGVDYDPNWRNERARSSVGMGNRALGAGAVGKVQNDDRANWSESWALFDGDVAYIWCASLTNDIVISSLEETGINRRSLIVWAKQHSAIGRSDYHWQHELCWYGVRKGKTGKWSGDRKQTTVWSIDKPQTSESGHSTQKPVECMRRPIQNNSQPGDYVYEPFAGSGTTIIAAEMMNRYCLAIEISPAYVDVCVRRWQDFAKAEATLEGSGRTFEQTAKERAKKPARRKPKPPVKTKPKAKRKSKPPPDTAILPQ